jgi:hypothetical protein
MTRNEQPAGGRGRHAPPDESEVLIDPVLLDAAGLEPATSEAERASGAARGAARGTASGPDFEAKRGDSQGGERSVGGSIGADGEAEEKLPSFSEQLASQIGGARGVIESGIPVAVFVVANIVASLNLALIISVASAVLIAIYRLSRRETVRHAVNGLFGIAIGAFIAWKTGSAKTFYLPGILLSCAYGLAMLASVPLRRPLVGWVWSVLADGGRRDWLDKPKMVKLFNRLTIVWAVTYLVKTVIQAWVFNNTAAHDPATALGIARLVLGYPPYAALLAYTIWSVRRLTARDPSLTAGPA